MSARPLLSARARALSTTTLIAKSTAEVGPALRPYPYLFPTNSVKVLVIDSILTAFSLAVISRVLMAARTDQMHLCDRRRQTATRWQHAATLQALYRASATPGTLGPGFHALTLMSVL
jgi:hypothetical protein